MYRTKTNVTSSASWTDLSVVSLSLLQGRKVSIRTAKIDLCKTFELFPQAYRHLFFPRLMLPSFNVSMPAHVLQYPVPSPSSLLPAAWESCLSYLSCRFISSTLFTFHHLLLNVGIHILRPWMKTCGKYVYSPRKDRLSPLEKGALDIRDLVQRIPSVETLRYFNNLTRVIEFKWRSLSYWSCMRSSSSKKNDIGLQSEMFKGNDTSNWSRSVA